jgi:RimJ/RimL family protein N-acetyltransferase
MELKFRKPSLSDLELYFEWVNDSKVRLQSFNSAPINLESHKNWYEEVLKDENSYMYLFQNQKDDNVGQVRIQKQNGNEAIIGISVASHHRGKGYASNMLILATNSFFEENIDYVIHAYIKESNLNSKYSFEKVGFKFVNMELHENSSSFHFVKKSQ